MNDAEDDDYGRYGLQRRPQVKLLPCPFCGKSDAFVERADFSSAYVMCNSCGAHGPTDCQDGDGEETPGEDAAKRLWNARATACCKGLAPIAECACEARYTQPARIV